MKSSKKSNPKLKINIQNPNYIVKTERNKDKLYKISIPFLNIKSNTINTNSKKNEVNNIKSNNLKNITERNFNHFNNNKRRSINDKSFINSMKSTYSPDKNHIENHEKEIKQRQSVIINRNNIKNKIKFLTDYKNNQKKYSSKSLNNTVKHKNRRSLILKKSSKIINLKPKKKEKKNDFYNPFEVNEEDKLFKKLLTKKKNNKKERKLRFYNSHDAPLSKVYKKIPYILNQLNQVKKLKNDMSLVKYQKALLEIGSKVLNRDLSSKLNLKFIEIRKSTEKKYDYLEKEIIKIEEKEKKIIKKINTQQNFFKKIMVNNNKSNWIYGQNKKIDYFPEINFIPLSKYLFN